MCGKENYIGQCKGDPPFTHSTFSQRSEICSRHHYTMYSQKKWEKLIPGVHSFIRSSCVSLGKNSSSLRKGLTRLSVSQNEPADYQCKPQSLVSVFFTFRSCHRSSAGVSFCRWARQALGWKLILYSSCRAPANEPQAPIHCTRVSRIQLQVSLGLIRSESTQKYIRSDDI
jgi:hypothetical protein